MKSNPKYHFSISKDLGIIRLLKCTLIWKNLDKAPRESAEKMGVPHLRLGKYSVRIMKTLAMLSVIWLSACGTVPAENLNEAQTLTKTRLYDAFLTQEIRSIPVVVLSVEEMEARFNGAESYTEFNAIYISEDADFCISLASEFYDIEMRVQKQFNNDPLGQFRFKLSYFCSGGI